VVHFLAERVRAAAVPIRGKPREGVVLGGVRASRRLKLLDRFEHRWERHRPPKPFQIRAQRGDIHEIALALALVLRRVEGGKRRLELDLAGGVGSKGLRKQLHVATRVDAQNHQVHTVWVVAESAVVAVVSLNGTADRRVAVLVLALDDDPANVRHEDVAVAGVNTRWEALVGIILRSGGDKNVAIDGRDAAGDVPAASRQRELTQSPGVRDGVVYFDDALARARLESEELATNDVDLVLEDGHTDVVARDERRSLFGVLLRNQVVRVVVRNVLFDGAFWFVEERLLARVCAVLVDVRGAGNNVQGPV